MTDRLRNGKFHIREWKQIDGKVRDDVLQKILNNLLLFLLPVAFLTKEYQFFILGITTAILFCFSKRITIDRFVVLCGGHILIYIVSCVRRLCIESVTYERIASTINIILIWIIAILLYQYFKNVRLNYSKIGKELFINGFVLSILAVIAEVFFILGIDNCNIGMSHILGSLYCIEEGSTMRFLGFFEYPTLVAAFVLMTYPWGVIHLKEKKTKLGIIGYTILMTITLFLSRSRSGYVLFSVILILGVFYLICCRTKRYYSVWSLTIVFCLLIFLLISSGEMERIFHYLLSMREGSQTFRFLLYQETWNKYIQSISNILVGYGIKIKCASPEYLSHLSLGSHCSYLGFLYKSGVIGTCMIMWAFVEKAKDLVLQAKHMKSFFGWFHICCMLLMAFFWLFEDMDGSNWLLCLWLSLLGIMSNSDYKKFIKEIENPKGTNSN